MFLESPGNSSGPESYFAIIQVQSFNDFKNNRMKLSVIEAKLTGSWTRTSAAIQEAWILKFASGFEKFPGLSRNGPLAMGWDDEIEEPYWTATVGDSPRASVNYGFSIQSSLNLSKSFPE